jgi:hypothetical protein
MPDILDQIVAAAQKADYDFTHTAPNRYSWTRVPDDQVRRLIIGAFGYLLGYKTSAGAYQAVSELLNVVSELVDPIGKQS